VSQERAGVWAAREAVDVSAVRGDLAQYLGIDGLIVEQLLRQRAVDAQCLLTDPQRAVGGDPPLFGRRAPGHTGWDQLVLQLRGVVERSVLFRKPRAGYVRAGIGQCLQPACQLLGIGKFGAAA